MCIDPGKGVDEQVGLYCLSPDCSAVGRGVLVDGTIQLREWGVAPSNPTAEVVMGPFCPIHASSSQPPSVA